MDDMTHLKRVKEAIEGDGSTRGRLQTAAQEFWSASFFADAWPGQLQEAASLSLPVCF
jgi:hypothetical protein